MESLKELYRIGPGPSSSHTLGVQRICLYFLEHYPNSDHYDVTLYGSLALTGKGHGSDEIIQETLGKDKTTVHFSNEQKKHPNTLTIQTKDVCMDFYSIGGGAFSIEGVPYQVDTNVYPENSMREIEVYCKEKGISLFDYVLEREPDILEYLETIWENMAQTIEKGLTKDGILPGELQLPRVAKELFIQANEINSDDLRITAYAYAAAEQNASRETVVTAPTLGSCGVLPAVLYYYLNEKGLPKQKIVEALAVAGTYGNIIKTNASISGAEGGCQAEIGTACAMAAAAASYLEGLSIEQISYAAEIGIEHNLGLTCDPVGGYVMIPCIERNGVAALRALDACLYANHLGRIRENRVSFDQVVETMNYTGKRIARELRETSLGGLAEVLKEKKNGN